MNRIVILMMTILVLLFSCGNDTHTGGATDIGNGYISGTIISPNGSPVIVSLATVDYHKNGANGEILYDTISSGEYFVFENLDSGEYALWAGDEKRYQYFESSLPVNSDSTILLDKQLKAFGGVVFEADIFGSDTIPLGLYVVGTDMQVTLQVDTNGNYKADSLPAGTYQVVLYYTDGQINDVLDTITIVPETVIEKSEDFTLVQLTTHPSNTTSRVLKSYNDTLWSGTEKGLGFYTNKKWDFHSIGLNTLSEIAIYDIARFKGGMFLATDAGFLKYEDNRWSTIGTVETYLEFFGTDDTLFVLSTNGVYYYVDTTLESLELDTLWNPQGTLTTFTISQEGEMWVGTDKQGVYIHNDTGWAKYTNVKNWELTTHNDFTTDEEGTVWLATEGEGLYYYQNSFWAKAPMEEYAGNIKEVRPINDTSIVFITYDGSCLHTIKGFTEKLTTLTFSQSAAYQIETIFVDSSNRIYLSGKEQGVYYLDLQ